MKLLESQLSRTTIVVTQIAALFMAIGLAWFLSAHVGMTAGDHIFSGEPSYLTNPVAMVQKAWTLEAVGEKRSVVMLGICLLLLGPPLRVVLCAVGFALRGDRLYAAISAGVVLILMVSFFW